MVIKKLYNRYKKPVKLYWWRYDYPNKLNFGDEITPLIISRVFGYRYVWSSPAECKLAGAGSIIEVLLSSKNRNKPVLWGSGFIKKGDAVISSDDFDIRAVRGKLTLERTANIDKKSIALGDPGLLADCLLSSLPEKKYRLGIVPHYIDMDLPIVKELALQKSVKIISPLNSPEEVIHDIAASESLISSSLHGLIVADSLGTPNAHIKLSDGLTGGIYKFQDYYSVFGGPSRHILLRPPEINKGNVNAISENVKKLYKKPTNLEALKQDLIKSFPY